MINQNIEDQLNSLGLNIPGTIYRNLPVQRLMEESILKGEGKIGHNGALMVDTGKYTGRSPKDKYFVVESSSKDNLWWGEVNQEISEDIFDELFCTYSEKHSPTSKMWGDKTPMNTMYLDWIGSVFPESKFIITYREPLSWLKSRLNYHHYKKPDNWEKYRNFICFN